MNIDLRKGDCREILKTIPDNSIDSIVTDPPYSLNFMNKKWDVAGIANDKEFWKEALRVLKPGGHLLSFGGTRTYHRMTCAIEDAGFEIRDCASFNYAVGFPKSQNISKAIDKRFGAEREVVGTRIHPTLKNPSKVKSRAFHVETLDSDEDVESWDITAPSTDEAKQWDGYGTTLKPSWEAIVIARKPLSEKTIVENVLKWGVGCINIDGCRIGDNAGWSYPNGAGGVYSKEYQQNSKIAKDWNKFSTKEDNKPIESTKGRFPANSIFAHSEDCVCVTKNNESKEVEAWDCVEGCPVKMLDEQSGVLKSVAVKPGGRRTASNALNTFHGEKTWRGASSTGSASRFFYTSKPSKKQRNIGCEDLPKQNNHPTVKPIDVMCWLVRLTCPSGGTVLDPFMGSGSTGVASVLEDRNFIGIELDEDPEVPAMEISRRRIDYAVNHTEEVRKLITKKKKS